LKAKKQEKCGGTRSQALKEKKKTKRMIEQLNRKEIEKKRRTQNRYV